MPGDGAARRHAPARPGGRRAPGPAPHRRRPAAARGRGRRPSASRAARERSLVVDVPQGGAAQHRALGEPPGAQARGRPARAGRATAGRQVEPRLVAPPEQLEEGGDRADRKSPVREGSTRGERGVEVGGLATPTRVVPGQQPRDRPCRRGRPGHRSRRSSRSRSSAPHVTRDPHQVGEQPVDGGDGIHGVALAPLRARPLPRRRERGPGDHPAGAVERHRLGDGGAEIDADVDGRGHVLRNLGMPGRIGQRRSRPPGDFGSRPQSVYRSRSQDGLPRAAHAPLVRVAELADALA